MHAILLVSACACLATVLARPQQPAGPVTPPIPIIKYENEGVNFDGSYKWSYETGNEITAQESGHVENAGVADKEAMQVEGTYSYTAPDGTRITMVYVAGPNGFEPRGDHIPTPPPIPEAIARALEYIKSQPPQPEEGQGSAPQPAYNAPQPAYNAPHQRLKY